MTEKNERKLSGWQLDELVEQVPFNIAIIDQDYRIVEANGNFDEYFGEWKGKYCYQVYKGLSGPCPDCQAKKTFEDGKVRVSDETGHDRHGRSCHYVVHMAPIKDDNGEIPYVVEMSTDLTATRRWQREYNLLFERVPCYVAIIDKDYRVIRANETFRNAFGDAAGELCYKVYKRRKTPCPNCPAKQTFADGQNHFSAQVGKLRDGSTAHYALTTAPLSRGADGIAHVIEIATDITEVRNLQEQLREAHDLYESLLKNSSSGLIVIDDKGTTTFINPAGRELLGWKGTKPPGAKRLRGLLPDCFFENMKGSKVTEWEEKRINTVNGNDIPVLFRRVELYSQRRWLGTAAFIRDQRDIKRLEREKLDSERLAAVGQTVAGLAHTIKNLLMGLEGGMYMVDTGMRKGNSERIAQGWEVLQTNFEKTTSLVKDFLSFAKGREPNLKIVDPNKLVNDIVELYRDTAKQQGVKLIAGLNNSIKPAPLDPDGMEACLTNLVSNGIDAVILRGKDNGQVVLRVREENGELIFEAQDNGCGMDWEVKQKIFTTFFTTKGGEGTGLGLLTTRKIVQEHGGKIELDSVENEGATFRIRLPRYRLEDMERQQRERSIESE